MLPADPQKPLAVPQCIPHSIRLIGNVLDRDLCRLFFIMFLDCFHDRRMFFQQLGMALFFLQILNAVTVHLLS